MLVSKMFYLSNANAKTSNRHLRMAANFQETGSLIRKRHDADVDVGKLQLSIVSTVLWLNFARCVVASISISFFLRNYQTELTDSDNVDCENPPDTCPELLQTGGAPVDNLMVCTRGYRRPNSDWLLYFDLFRCTAH
jgi:hypothetical protein